MTSHKITQTTPFLPVSLTDLLIKESDIKTISIEEEKSELYYKTLHGIGTITFKNNVQYTGNVKYGILENAPDRKCRIVFENGTEYEGEIKSNQISGKGKYTFPSGAIYTGDVFNGLRHGKGTYESSKDGVVYEGDWVQGLKQGKGTLTIKDQMTFTGEFFEGIKHGFGKIQWKTKNLYEGFFKSNKINGNGVMVWNDSSEKYQGQWEDNLQNGMGIHIWYESKGEQKYLRNRYVGEWKNGFRHGYGVFFYANGGKYEGMWDTNYKNGFGIFTFHDGSTYVGKFSNDRMEFSSQGYLRDESLKKHQVPATKSNQTVKGSSSSLPKVTNSNAKQGGAQGSTSIPKSNFMKELKPLKSIADVNEDEEEKESPSPQSKMKSAMKSEIKKDDGKGKNEDKKEKSVDNKIKERRQSDKNKISEKSLPKISNIKKEKVKEKTEETKSKEPEKEKTKEKENPSENKIIVKKSVVIKDPLTEKEEKIEAVANKTVSKFIGSESPSKITKRESNVSPKKENSKEVDPKKDESKSVFTAHLRREEDQNPFKNLLDITDIIETETELESSLREVENLLLRNLSDMKMWYKIYSLKDDTSELHPQTSGHRPSLLNSDTRDIHKDHNPNEILNDCNDVGYAMELKDLWKFIRESNIASIDFSLASFNRLFFRGPKNYIEMFVCPDELKHYSKEFFDHFYNSITKAKEDFLFKNREKFLNGTNNTKEQNEEFANLLFKPSEIEIDVDIHYKKHVILQRQFYEAIVRIAYLKYFQYDEPLHKKIKMLMDNCIKFNPNLKKLKKKSIDTSLNSTVMIDFRFKNLESTFEPFLKEYDVLLKQIFRSLFDRSISAYKKTDKTITYRFFYNNIVLKSDVMSVNINKYDFAEFVNIWHKDKIIFSEENKNSREILIYIENLFDCEMIYFEFSELVFHCIRKSNHNDLKKEKTDSIINNLVLLAKRADKANYTNEKLKYFYPRLKNHTIYLNIIEQDKQRKIQEEKKRNELLKIEFERKMMKFEDENVIPKEEEEEENENMSNEEIEEENEDN